MNHEASPLSDYDSEHPRDKSPAVEAITSEVGEVAIGHDDHTSGGQAPPTEASYTKHQAESLGLRAIEDAVSLNWEVADKLGGERQKARELVDSAYDQYSPYIPALAGALGGKPEEKAHIVWPRAEQIKDVNVEARFVSDICGIVDFFSFGIFGLREQFDHYIEDKARQRIVFTAHQIRRPLDALGQFSNVREQFVAELTSVYNHLAAPPKTTESTRTILYGISCNNFICLST